MTLLQITPGAGAMYCGLCCRDNALVAALRRLGHQVIMVPLYLPFNLDEPDESADTPIFFSGINVYLEQKSAFFRAAPRWFRGLLKSRTLLKWASGRAAKTRPDQVGDITLSMLRGENGHQAADLEELLAWLKSRPRPDVVCLSTALLLGMTHRLKTELGAPLLCLFQGEAPFLDSLPPAERTASWRLMAERAAEVDRFIAPSRYVAELMRERLGLPAERLEVIPNGISLAGYETERPANSPPSRHGGTPVLGYFARMCPEKGLDTLVAAFILLRQRGRVNNLRLRVGGGCGPSDEPFVQSLRKRLDDAGLSAHAEFCPNLDRAAKIDFLRSLSVFSVPALYGEAFGLYVIEALAAGVPVVQPRTAAFTELVEATGGGVLCAPGEPQALADDIEGLLLDPARAHVLGETGRQAVRSKFTAEAMARETLRLCQELSPARLTGAPIHSV